MMRTHTHRVIAVIAVASAAALVGAPHVGAEPDPEANTGSTYTITARADAFAVEFSDSAAPVTQDGQVIYATPSSAQSLVDSVGRSQAFASAPYPGSFLYEVGGNGNGVLAGFGVPFAFPDYPFYAGSEHPVTPKAERDQGPSRISAQSDEQSSKSDARFGPPTAAEPAIATAAASSSAAFDPSSGSQTAVADARFDGFAAGPLVLGRSTAHARITKLPGQAPAKESAFTVASLEIGGVPVAVTDKGFKLGSSAPPAVDMTSLLAALAKEGIAIEFFPASGTETSINSAGLRISRTTTSPAGTTQRVTVIIGRVTTGIQEGAGAAASDSLPGAETTDAAAVPAAEAGTVAAPSSALDTGVASAALSVDPALEPFPAEDTGMLLATEPAAVGPANLVAAPPPGVEARPAPGPMPQPRPAAASKEADVKQLYLWLAVFGAAATLRPRRRGASTTTPQPSLLRLPNR